MKITKEFVKILADNIMIELTDEEEEAVLKTENDILSKFEKVFAINTEGIEESHQPFNNEHTYLRDDNEVQAISKADALKNAPQVQDGYITIARVVK